MSITVRLDHLFDLGGRTALITGGSSGLGLAIAEALGRQGARIVLVARRAPELQREADRLEKIGIEASFIAADLAAPGGPDEVAELLPGPVDVLVNAAGINLRQAFETVTLEAFDQHMAIHLRAPFRLIQRLAPTMAERHFGRIIMLASLQSVRAFANSASYGIAKGGVIQLTGGRALVPTWRHLQCNRSRLFPYCVNESRVPRRSRGREERRPDGNRPEWRSCGLIRSRDIFRV